MQSIGRLLAEGETRLIVAVETGRIPLMRTNINVQELVLAALMQEERAHIYHAAMLDPHTAAELDLDQIQALTDELIAAHKDWLPDWIENKPGRNKR